MTNNPPEEKVPDSNWEHFTVWETIKSLLLIEDLWKDGSNV